MKGGTIIAIFYPVPFIIMRVVTNRKSAEKHFRRVVAYAPKTGVVRFIKLTEEQYENMVYITGEKDLQDKIVGNNCLIMI